MDTVYKLVLIRHGESLWNKENRFTGWTDVDLNAAGETESHTAARLLLANKLDFDIAFTSVLTRAIRTLWIIQDDMHRMYLPVEKTWRLNERHYGALQGLDKAETARLAGKAQVHLWRRSYTTRPPALEWDDPRHPRFDPRYAGIDPSLLPATESLQDTLGRVLPCWTETIWPLINQGRRLLIVAHGNSLRALVKHLEKIPDEAIPDVHIPTGIPWVYELSPDLKVVRRHVLES